MPMRSETSSWQNHVAKDDHVVPISRQHTMSLCCSGGTCSFEPELHAIRLVSLLQD
jgi:hypothetical protein